MTPTYLLIDSKYRLKGGEPSNFRTQLSIQLPNTIKGVKLCNVSMLNSSQNLFPYFYIDIRQVSNINGMITPNNIPQTFVVFTDSDSSCIKLSHEMSIPYQSVLSHNILDIKITDRDNNPIELKDDWAMLLKFEY